MIIEIKSVADIVLWTGEAKNTRDAVEKAVAQGAWLQGARLEGARLQDARLEGARLEGARLEGAWLQGARLEGARLQGARLEGARLEGARLEGAWLQGARLEGARIEGARLEGARLEGARLEGARLQGARLQGARLEGARLEGARLEGAWLQGARLEGARIEGARLEGARLEGARLEGARLEEIKTDLHKVLAAASAEVPGLLAALREGRVDGSQYEGECACLVGTVANIRKEEYRALTIDLRPDSARFAEIWFLSIRKGDTPANNQISAITVGWIESWLKKQGRPVAPHVPIFWRGDLAQLQKDLVAAGIPAYVTAAPMLGGVP